MVSNKLTVEDVEKKAGELSLPKSVVEYLQGHIGQPHGGFPEPLRSNVLRDMPRINDRPGATLPPLDFEKIKTELLSQFSRVTDNDVMSAALYPDVTRDYLQFREKFGPVDKLNTRVFLTGPKVGEEFNVTIRKGKKLSIKTLATSEDLTENGEREVFFELNGILKSVYVKDKNAAKVVEVHPKANKSDPKQIGAPMPGIVIDIRVKVGEKIEKGTPVVILSAMKMETVVQSPVAGVVQSIAINLSMSLEAEDLILTIE